MRSIQAIIAASVAGIVTLAGGPIVAQTGASLLNGTAAFGDWRTDRPGTRRLIRAQDLPAPDMAESARNFVRIVHRTNEQKPIVPNGFEVNLFASGLAGPRIIRTAPNGDIFVAESGAGRIRVLRPNGTAAAEPSVFASGLRYPFGIAFYPPGNDPQWVYIGNTDSVVRFPYRNGDLTARGGAEIRSAAFAGRRTRHPRCRVLAGRQNDVCLGGLRIQCRRRHGKTFRSRIAELGRKSSARRDLGSEAGRADVLTFDPDGENAHIFATGIRNCVGLAVAPPDGTVWCSTNERDGLGDDVPPDYITRVRAGGFYGWPWYYIGAHEDPRHRSERPDLQNQITDPGRALAGAFGLAWHDVL